jgi:hypothetical protein
MLVIARRRKESKKTLHHVTLVFIGFRIKSNANSETCARMLLTSDVCDAKFSALQSSIRSTFNVFSASTFVTLWRVTDANSQRRNHACSPRDAAHSFTNGLCLAANVALTRNCCGGRSEFVELVWTKCRQACSSEVNCHACLFKFLQDSGRHASKP